MVISNSLGDDTGDKDEMLKQARDTEHMVHPIYRTARSLVSSSREVIKLYERSCQHLQSGKSTLGVEPEWKRDSEKLQTILNGQRKIIKQQIYSHLHGTKISSKERPAVAASLAEGEDLWSRYALSPSHNDKGPKVGSLVEGWALAAKNAQKGVQRMMRNVPDD